MHHPLLLETKLCPPKLRAGTITRPDLLQRLDQSARLNFCLVVAPAGFGKTTLLLQWLANRTEPLAWLSLEESEDSFAPFLIYLITALQRIDPSFGTSAIIQLQTKQNPEIKALLIPLINQLHKYNQAFTCIVDDFHYITQPKIHEALSFLLQHLPSHGHFLLASRCMPLFSLVRLQAKGEAHLFPAESMRFGLSQAEQFFQETMKVELSQKELVLLHQRTEGWISGLQLAGLSIQYLPDRQAITEGFSGENPFVADFLTTEVFTHLPEREQQFLLETSILQQLSPTLCDAVGQSKDSRALLRSLERAHLFIVPLDSKREWYRYHHLFRNWLQHRLLQTQKEWVPTLHQRAAAWCKENGLVNKAIHHLLEASLSEQAAQLLEKEAPALLKQDVCTSFLQSIDSLPSSIVSQRPKLALYRICALYSLGSSHRVQLKQHVSSLLASLSKETEDEPPNIEPNAPLTKGIEYLTKSIIGRLTGQVESCTKYATKAYEIIPETDDYLSAQAFVIKSTSEYRTKGLTQSLQKELETVVIHCLQKRNAHHGLNLASLLCRALSEHGKRAKQEEFIRTFAEILENQWGQTLPPLASVILSAVRGELHYQHNQLEEAESQFKQSVKAAEELGEGRLLRNSQAFLALVYHAQKKNDAALALCQKIPPAHKQAPTLTRWSFAKRMQLTLALGDKEQVRTWMRSHSLHINDTIQRDNYTDYLVVVRFLWSEHRWDEATKLASKLQSSCEKLTIFQGHLEALLLQSLLLQAQDAEEKAQQMLQNALLLAEPLGHIRLFLDQGKMMHSLLEKQYAKHNSENPALRSFIKRLCKAFDKYALLDEAITSQSVSSSTIRYNPPKNQNEEPRPSSLSVPKQQNDLYFLDPLSQREEELLKLAAEGHTNQELASQLHISLSTVKTHMRHIYSKLGVKNRTQAFKRARNLSLLS